MYGTIKDVIESGRYELSDMLKKIDTIWLQGDITEEQKTELVKLAQEKADPENSYAPLQKQIDNLYEVVGTMETALKSVTDRVTKLEDGEIEPSDTTEYPEYKQPTGSHDAYNTGDKITYTDGKYYICQIDNCVWSPEVYPSGWKLVE